MHFYTNFELFGSKLFLREYKNGIRSKRKIHIKPTLYLENQESTEKFKNIFGKPLSSVELESVQEARKFKEDYAGTGVSVYGFDRWDYTKIHELFPTQIAFDSDLINTVYIDIECEVEHGGFPDVDTAPEVINLITLGFKDKYYTLGLEHEVTVDLPENAVYKRFDTEEALLKAFIDLFVKLDPDILTGWNNVLFDMPYLFSRIERVLGEGEFSKLSPWKKVSKKEVFAKGRKQTKIVIHGITIIDYIDIYKKFQLKGRESYKLGYIAYTELGESKIDYTEEGNFKTLYKTNWNKFVLYNIKDVELVIRLEKKLKFIALCQQISFISRTNFSDVYSNVRLWDVIIANYLREKNIITPISKMDTGESDEPYEGAYVKNPLVGLYRWFGSFDYTSLYPRNISTFNISPETDTYTKIGDHFPEYKYINSDFVVNNVKEIEEKIKPFLVENNYSMASNGTLYKNDVKGFLPELMELYFGYRNDAKKEMKKYKKEKEKIDEILKTRGIKV